MKKDTIIDVEQKKKDSYPEGAFKKWISLLEEELPKFFKDKDLTVVKECPGCGKKNKGVPVFNKFGFNYHRCSACESLYVSPRPSRDMVYKFFQNSNATKHWYREMFLPSLPSRTVHSINPLSLWVGSIIKRFAPHAERVLDYRPWTFSIAVRPDFPVKSKPFVYKPLYTEFKGKVTELKKLSGTFDVVISLDDIDRESDMGEFFSTVSKLQKPGGLLFLTGNTASGFEYQVLGEYSLRLVIPDRLNLLSIEAIRALLNKYGYTILDISTPNKLDVEFVREQLESNKNIQVSGFLKYLLTQRDETVLQSFQDFLQLSHLTSYCRIAAQKIK